MNCNCGRPTRDDAYVCDEDLSELAIALGNVPAVVEELTITLGREKGIDYAADSAHGKTVPLAKKDVDDDGDKGADARTSLAYHHGASEALAQLRQTLTTWARFCDEEGIRHQSTKNGLPEPDEGIRISLQALSRWLLWRVDGLGFSDLGCDAVSDITRAVGRCVMVIDRPAERVYAGPCECGRDLYAKPSAKVTKCPACEREWNVEEMRDWMRSNVMGRLVTAHEGAVLLGKFELPVAQKTIDSWHERKRIVDHGRNSAGKLLYLIDDLFQLAAKRAA